MFEDTQGVIRICKSPKRKRPTTKNNVLHKTHYADI